MINKNDIDIKLVKESLESLKKMTNNNEYCENLLVLGDCQYGVIEPTMSNDEEIKRIDREINKHINDM